MKAIETYDKLKQPPAWALKEIGAGRLKNMTQINPQWRYQAMTEQFGLCGVGWKYEVKRLWTEPGAEDQVLAFAEVALYIETFGADGTPIWSSPIPGVGGSMLTAKESKGLHSSDECYKMAITDALSVAMKMIGVGADVYAGAWNGEGYKDRRSKEASLSTASMKTSVTPTEMLKLLSLPACRFAPTNSMMSG